MNANKEGTVHDFYPTHCYDQHSSFFYSLFILLLLCLYLQWKKSTESTIFPLYFRRFAHTHTSSIQLYCGAQTNLCK